MCFFVFFCVLIIFFDGCISEKHVLFIHDTMDTTAKEELLKEVKQVAIQLFQIESDFSFKIIHPREPDIVEITKSISGTSPLISTSHNDFHTKNQSTLQNLQTWLQKSPSNSVIYAITDDTHSSDQHLINEILETLQVKRTEVNFIVTSQHLENHTFEVYKLISFMNDGICAQLNLSMEYFNNNIAHLLSLVQYDDLQNEVHRFADLLYLRLKFASKKVTLSILPYGDSNGDSFQLFQIDSFLTEVTAVFPANYSIIFGYSKKIIKPAARKNRLDRIYIHRNITPPNPSIHSLYYVMGGSEFDFIYGFSTDTVNSMDETYMRPIKGQSNQIYVTSNNKTCPASFLIYDIILTDGDLFERDYLNPVENNANLFVGSFKLPNEEYFRIQVLVNKTEYFFRISSHAINAANGFGEDHNNPKLGSDRCISEKHVLFIHDTMDTTAKEELLKEVKQVATQLFEIESFNFKIIHPREPDIVKITKSISGTSPSISTSHNDFHTKNQSTLQNLQKWLHKSPSNSVIYVITDDTHCSDQHLINEILETLQIIRTEVNFIVTSQHLENHTFEVYKLISFMNDGICAQLNLSMEYFNNNISHLLSMVQYGDLQNEVHRFADLLYLRLKFASKKVTLSILPYGDSNGDSFKLLQTDSFLTEVTVVFPANYSIVFGYSKKIIKPLKHYGLDRIYIHRNITPHNPPTHSLYYAIGGSEFDFIYGFSTNLVNSMDETYLRPIKASSGQSNLIYVTSKNKTSPASFLMYDIILTDGDSFERGFLNPVENNANLFVGSFKLPYEEYFRIQVLVNNTEYFFRMSSHAINAANGFGEDHNNPKLGSDRIPLQTYLLILISIFSIVILGEVIYIILTYKKSSELPPTLLELEKPHPRARSNFYHPVSYNSRGQNVEII